jgi:hypothetical protein
VSRWQPPLAGHDALGVLFIVLLYILEESP